MQHPFFPSTLYKHMTRKVKDMTPEEHAEHRKIQNSYRAANREKHAAQRAELRKVKQHKLLALRNYTCEICGLVETELGFFEFHHTDPSTKDREIGSMLNSASFDKVLVELDKCLMLCPNCHKREHMKDGMRYADIRSIK